MRQLNFVRETNVFFTVTVTFSKIFKKEGEALFLCDF